MISAESHGSFKNTEALLQKLSRFDVRPILEASAKAGVSALQANTPEDSGLSADSWGYKVYIDRGHAKIIWTNKDVENGFPVAIMLQYGYGTGTGGYVQGRDYINPAMQPVFDRIADQVWKAVTSA